MKYKAAEHMLMRCPTRSLNEFYDFSKLSDDEIMTFCRQDKLFAEAVAIASQDLYKMYADNSVKTTTRMLESVKKYYDRMTARPTPYGLFAGVTTAQFSDEGTNICLAEQEKYHKICRVDNEWYFKLVKKIEETPGLLFNLQVIFNKHCNKVYGRLKNGYCSNLRKENVNHAEDLHIRYTKQVQYVQEFASDFVAFKDLRDFLINKNPNVPPEIIDKFLKELLLNEYLYTNICALSKEEDPLHKLLQENDFHNLSDDEAAFIQKLQEIDRLREEYAQMPFGQGEEILAQLSGLMEQTVKAKNYIYTILQLNAISNKLDSKIKDDLENFSEFMQAVATPDNESEQLLAFKEAFREKYGSDAMVSLLEVIDADKGIGLPYSGYIAEMNTAKYAKRNSKKLDAIKMMLENKMLTALRQGQSVVEITDKDIEHIKPIDSEIINKLAYVSSFSLNVLVTQNGADYEIHIGPNVGSTQAGNGISRFDAALNDDFSQELDEIYAKEKALHRKDYVIADVYEVSHYLRNTNLYSYKRQYDYNLYLGITEFEHNTSLNLNDLYLGYDGQKDRMFIWSKSLNKRVKFMTNSMYNTQSSNPIIRFLRNISTGYEMSLIDNLFVFQSLKYAYWPKLKYGNIVLANEKWRLSPEQFADCSERNFAAALQEYLLAWQLPKYVYFTHNDNRLILDLDDELTTKLLYRALVKQKQQVILERMEYEDISNAVAEDKRGQFYAAEFSVPMFSRELAEKQSTAITDTYSAYTKPNLIKNFFLPERVLYLGDDGWLYFKIYLNPIQANPFLAQYLEPFLTDLFEQKIIKSFFFIKYADPKYHIRLRLQITEPDKLGVALQKFRDWFNLLQENLISYEYTIAQYEREIERYGGSALMPYAENYFYQDSRLVIALLQEIKKDAEEIEREKVGIFAIHSLVDCFCGSLQSDSDFLIKYTNNIEHKDLFRKNKKDYLAVIEDDFINNFADKTQIIIEARTAAIKKYAEKIRQAESQEMLANSWDNILLTLIHMFCNRYNGNREWERKVLFLTRHIVFTKNNMLLHNNK
jgi:thiopeptide-type bacteriocin biosynthesis protein